MSHIINALFTCLKWKLHDLTNQQTTLRKKLEHLNHNIKENTQHIRTASAIPKFILPEQEIARSHFLNHQQILLDQLHVQKDSLLSEQTSLINQHIHLKYQQKRLEKHQLTKQHQKKRLLLQKEQNNRDEWALQQRGLNEN